MIAALLGAPGLLLGEGVPTVAATPEGLVIASPTDVLSASSIGEPVRLRQQVTRVTDLSPAGTRSAPTPGDAVGIGPGSPILQTIPGEGTFICTANFVFASGGNYYLGSAGHCFLPADEISTHGTSDNYNAAGVVVEVCVADCF